VITSSSTPPCFVIPFIAGSPKAAVLPVPVCAWATRSRPARATGIACSWMGLGTLNPAAVIPSMMAGLRPNPAKPEAGSAAGVSAGVVSAAASEG
jgi:hypothetical protein